MMTEFKFKYQYNNECLTHFSQFMSEKAKKNLRKSQAQFREKLRKLRLRQNNNFLIKKRVFTGIGKENGASQIVDTHCKMIKYFIIVLK